MLNIFIYYLGLGIERTERSRTIPSFRNKNEHMNAFLKLLEQFVKELNEHFWKEVLNQEHDHIIKNAF